MVFSPWSPLYLRVYKTQIRVAAWSYIISKEDRPSGAYKQLFVAKELFVINKQGQKAERD
jgi:hypothetical protein